MELAAHAVLVDLDNPAVLAAQMLRPSIVATGRRGITQAYAVRQFERHPDAAGLRWWSTLEASWIHVTLFDRALGAVNVRGVRKLAVDDEVVTTAAAHLGLARLERCLGRSQCRDRFAPRPDRKGSRGAD